MNDVNTLADTLAWLLLVAAALAALVASGYLLSWPLKKWDEARRRARRRADRAADLRKLQARREHARDQMQRG